MYRGSSLLAGASPEGISLPLVQAWRYTAPYSAAASYNPASPAVVDGVVYMSSGDRLVALDATSGALKWRYPQEEKIPSAIRTSPAVSDGFVVFGSADGKMFAVDIQTHRLVWTFDSQSGISTSPVIAEGIVYFGSADGRVWAINLQTGTQVAAWKGGVRAPEEVAGAVAVSDGIVFILTADQMLYAVAASTAKLRSSARLDGPTLHQCPVIHGELLYVAAGSSIECRRTTNVGARRWGRSILSDVAEPPIVSDDGVYIVSTDGHIYALDPMTGRPKWKTFPVIDLDVGAPPVLAGKTLVVGTVQGSIYGFDTDTGAQKWTYVIAASTADTQSVLRFTNVTASPVVSNGNLYVFTDDGSLTCFSPNAVDTTPPSVADIEPEPGIVCNGAPPIHYQARLYDFGSGLDTDSIRLYVDDEPVLKKGPEDAQGQTKPGFTFDRITSLLEYDSPKATAAAANRMLADGRHIVRLVASDWKGNTVEKQWSFTVDNTLKRMISGRQRIPRDSDKNLKNGSGINSSRFGGTAGGGSDTNEGTNH